MPPPSPGREPDPERLPIGSPRFFALLATALLLLACGIGVAAVLVGYDVF
jgi:hypothetical protein